MIKDIQLDHIAVAVDSWEDGWPVLVDKLHAKWRSGGMQPGFKPSQYAFENELKIELIAPYLTDQNDFLKRFVEKSGTGPHHMTFKVKDISDAIQSAKNAGFTIVSQNTANDWWKEAFLHPKETCGIVIQLAQAAGTWFVPPPDNLPNSTSPVKSSFRFISYVVKDFSAAKRLFVDLLGGQILHQGKTGIENLDYLYIGWPGPGRIMIVYSNQKNDQELGMFLSGRLGRVNYLYFEFEQTGDCNSNFEDCDREGLNSTNLYITDGLLSEILELAPVNSLKIINPVHNFNVRSVINCLS